MRVADEIRLDNSKIDSSKYDGLITLSYAIFAITFLVMIYAASMSSGTASSEFASMSAFP